MGQGQGHDRARDRDRDLGKKGKRQLSMIEITTMTETGVKRPKSDRE